MGENDLVKDWAHHHGQSQAGVTGNGLTEASRERLLTAANEVARKLEEAMDPKQVNDLSYSRATGDYDLIPAKILLLFLLPDLVKLSRMYFYRVWTAARIITQTTFFCAGRLLSGLECFGVSNGVSL